MTSMFGIGPLKLSNIDVSRWAEKYKIYLPVNFRKTPEQEKMHLKMLYLSRFFKKMTPVEHRDQMAEALEEAMKNSLESGLSDRAVALIQIVTIIFLTILNLGELASSSKL
jgi:hypothetical protein